MNYNIDTDRKARLGFPEVIFGATKPVEALENIIKAYQKKGEAALATKVQVEKAEKLLKVFPNAIYDELSGSFLWRKEIPKLIEDQIAVISAGTSDQYVVNEALYTLEYLGHKAGCIQDIGVAGLHRLLNRLEDLRKFKVLIVVAGFEGALPTVVGGLLPQPIIAVPTSVGYGVSADGKAALHTMLASCANGITVVNIDNGYGAAMAAFRILRLLDS